MDFVGDVADYVSFLSDAIISKAGSRREVFSSLNFYTTQVRRITKRYLESAVSMGDIMKKIYPFLTVLIIVLMVCADFFQ